MSEQTTYTIDDDVEPGSDVLIITGEDDVPIGRIYGFDHFPCFDPEETDPNVAHAETVALAERFTDCVNACRGINPEGVPEMVKALEEMLLAMHEYDMDVDEEPPYKHREMMKRARAALSKARVTGIQPSSNTTEKDGE